MQQGNRTKVIALVWNRLPLTRYFDGDEAAMQCGDLIKASQADAQSTV